MEEVAPEATIYIHTHSHIHIHIIRMQERERVVGRGWRRVSGRGGRVERERARERT